jgi:hypothetical protein
MTRPAQTSARTPKAAATLEIRNVLRHMPLMMFSFRQFLLADPVRSIM